MKNLKKFEGWFSKEEKDPKLKEVEDKLSDAAFSLQTFGTISKQGAFVNGAKWAICNLTEEEIQTIRDHTSEDDFSFFGF